MIKIFNNEKFITNKQLDEVFRLMSDKYISRKITILHNRLESVYYFIRNFDLYNLFILSLTIFSKNQEYYDFIHDNAIVFVYNNKQENDAWQQYEIIKSITLLFRIRHYHYDNIKEAEKLDIFHILDALHRTEMISDPQYENLINNYIDKFMEDNLDKLTEIFDWEVGGV